MARNTAGARAATTPVNTFVDDTAVLDTAHVGDIRGALGTIRREDVAAPAGPVCQAEDAAGDHRAGAHRHGGRQRRRRVWDLHPGWAELRYPPFVDAVATRAGPLRQPGDGATSGRSLGSWPCQADPGKVREVLGGVQRDRPVHPERADDRDRVHRRDIGRRLPRAAEDPLCGARRSSRCRRCQYGKLSPLREDLSRAGGRIARAHPDIPDGPPAGNSNGPEFRRTGTATRGSAIYSDAPHNRNSRYDCGPLAAFLPAVLCDRQADHAPVHKVRARRPLHRDCNRGRGSGRNVRLFRCHVRRATGVRQLHQCSRCRSGTRDVCITDYRRLVRHCACWTPVSSGPRQ